VQFTEKEMGVQDELWSFIQAAEATALRVVVLC
jgi:hypothetical protein